MTPRTTLPDLDGRYARDGLLATAPDWRRLEGSLTGELLLPGAPGYDSARRPEQPPPTEHRPVAVVMAANAADVAAVIAFGREHGIATVPRSGGHCFAGRSSTHGVVIDVTAMNDVTVSGRRVTVGAGARLGKIYDALEPAGLTLPAGTWPTVGIAGHALGGGAGFLGRTHGLTSDQLVAAEIVLADGQVVWCDDASDPDLFWALRGAGGGQFGVVTTLVLEPVRAPATTSSFHLTWPYEHAATVTAAWQGWAPRAPDAFDASLRLVAPADPRRAPEVNVFGMMLDANASTTARWLADIIDAVRAEPTWVSHDQSSYLTAKRRLTGLGTDHRPGSTPDSAMVIRSEFFRRPLPAAAVTALTEQLAARRTPGYVRELNFSPWAGAYNRVPVDATSFAHRGELFMLEHTTHVSSPTDRVLAQARTWRDGSWQIAHPWGAGGVYPNFPDPDLKDGEAAYHGPNLTRLRQVKRRYDPDDWFRFHQSITPARRIPAHRR